MIFLCYLIVTCIARFEIGIRLFHNSHILYHVLVYRYIVVNTINMYRYRFQLLLLVIKNTYMSGVSKFNSF
jgi:hypothetical protein